MRLQTTLLAATALAVGTLAAGAVLAEPPPLEKKDSYVVGFAQTESNNPWRLAESRSMEEMAEENGWQLIATDAAGSAAKQVSDVDSLIAQGVDVLVIAPREEVPLATAVMHAKDAGIPVVLVDRNVDQSIAKAGEDYITFIGSNFVQQGQRAAQWLLDNYKDEDGDGVVKIIELEGTTGSSPANDRKRGFDEAIAQNDQFQIVASQTGDFARDLGRQVAESLLQSNPDVDVIYAHNDEMAIGAIAALEAAGLEPGKDVTVVSIDGTCDAMQAILDGKMAITVESRPFMGPLAAQVIKDYADGKEIPTWVVIEDRVFDPSNASTDPSMCF